MCVAKREDAPVARFGYSSNLRCEAKREGSPVARFRCSHISRCAAKLEYFLISLCGCWRCPLLHIHLLSSVRMISGNMDIWKEGCSCNKFVDFQCLVFFNGVFFLCWRRDVIDNFAKKLGRFSLSSFL